MGLEQEERILSVRISVPSNQNGRSDSRVPIFWNKKNVSSVSEYRYPRIRTSVQKNSNSEIPHPLGLDMTKIQNFEYLHRMLHPDQARHYGDPNSTVKPNKILLGKHVTERKMNIRKLKVEDYVVARLKKNYQAEKSKRPINAK